MPDPIRRLFALACCVATLVGSAVAAEPRVTVETIDDELRGELLQLDSSRGLRLGGDSFVRLPRRSVLRVSFDDPPRRERDEGAGSITLVNGSRFAYTRLAITEDRLRFETATGATVRAPLTAVRDWRLVADGEGFASNASPTEEASDTLFVRRRDGSLTPVSGVVLGVDASGVRFLLASEAGIDADAKPIEAPWNRVAGIDFYRRETPTERASAVAIACGDGHALVAETVRLDDGRLVWEARDAAGEIPVSVVRSIDLSAGRVTPVRGLESLKSRWTPYLGGGTSSVRRGYAFDEAIRPAPLTLRFPDPRAPAAWPDLAQRRRFESGVALRSRGELRFALPEGSVRLRGWVGLDPATAATGDALVAVLADEVPLWEGTVNGATRPVALNASLDGARTLTLRVDYGDNLDTGDNVHFADLRVIR